MTVTSDKSVYTDDDNVTLTATVENKGNKTFKNVSVTNSLPGCKITDFDGDKAEKAEDESTALISVLEPNDIVTFVYELSAKEIETGKNAAVQATVEAGDGTNFGASIANFRVIRPGVTIKATPEKAEYRDNEDVVYKALITNTGNNNLSNVKVSADIMGTFAESDFGSIGTKGDFIISELPVGQSVSLTYTVKPENTIYGTMNNSFKATVSEDVSAETKTEVKIVYYGVDVMKTVENDTYVVNDTVVFHTMISNTGDGELKNIYITEDKEGSFKLTDGAVIYTDDTIVILTLMPGESYNYDYFVPASENNIVDGVLTSTSSVSIDDEVIGTDSNFARIYTQGMTFSKTVDADKEYRRGDKVVWTDKVTNTGECDLTNVVITESLLGTFNTDYETTADSVTIPRIKKGESIEIEFTTTISPADIVETTYTCTANVTVSENIFDEASASIKIIGPAVTVGKYADKPIYAPGERVVYTDVIVNSGDKDLTNVKVTENLAGKFMRYDKSWTVDENILTIPEIKVGDSVVFHYAVDRSLIEGNKVESVVTVTCDQNVTDSAELTVLLSEPVTDTSKDEPASDTSSDELTTDTSSENTDTDDEKETDDQPVKYMMGDVNMDGKVTGHDSLLIQRYAIGLLKLNDLQLFLSDVTQDGKTTASDALNIIRYTINLNTSSIAGKLVSVPDELLPIKQ